MKSNLSEGKIIFDDEILLRNMKYTPDLACGDFISHLKTHEMRISHFKKIFHSIVLGSHTQTIEKIS